ncbi:serine threonine- kinase pim-2-like protein [Labeo rohita]|uniref:non-specific serine/threonine protein kinase n=1 Tax=Labeo rohita TaxID=84645 RepID=A0A498NXS4_LABRO|nr:serine threonine- kinase pim-2-like protein [Labeo rohita]
MDPAPSASMTPESVPGPSGIETPPSGSGSGRIEPLSASVHLKYDLGGDLGRGCYGQVKMAVRKSDGQKVAIKFIQNIQGEPEDYLPGYPCKLPIEVVLMSLVKDPPSPHIVELFEWFEDSKTLVLVMEYLETFTTLASFLDNTGPLQESVARTLMVEIVQSAKECAEHGVCHLDMHVCNIMVDAASLKVKLIDFGGGKRIGEPDEHTDPETRIPLQEGLNEMMYSLGQLLGWLVYSDDKGIPEEYEELINWCKNNDHVDQNCFEELLMHPWFQEQSASGTSE